MHDGGAFGSRREREHNDRVRLRRLGLRAALPDEDPDIGVPGSIKQIDTYTVPEAQNAAHATGSGTLSVHEVVMDPNPGRMLAYLSYYDAGLRVVRFSATTARCAAASSSP